MSPSRKRPALSNYTIAESTRLLRKMTGRKHALLAGRGAAGIWAALRALELRDEYVLIPANTCYIVLWAVLKSGNKPLLVDVDVATGNVKRSAFSGQRSAKEKAIHHRGTVGGNTLTPGPSPSGRGERKPAAVIPCYMYGLPAPMAEICAWARANGVYVIEDAALALGATVDGRLAGAWGDVSVFSFGLGKIADNQVGGALLTDDDRLARDIEKLLLEMPVWDDGLMGLTNQWNAIYWALHQYEAHNPRLLELYPALYEVYGELIGYRLPVSYWDDLPGLLRDLPANMAHRAALARAYDTYLTPQPPFHPIERGSRSDSHIRIFSRLEGAVLWRYPLLVEAGQRDELLQYLWEHGVPDATCWYPSLRYMTAALAPDVEQPPTPDADMLGASIINLRVDPGVDQAYVERTARLIREYFSEKPTSRS